MKSLFVLAAISTLSLNANAASKLACKQEVEAAVEDRSGGEANVTGIRSTDGEKYEVSFYWSGDEAVTSETATVTVNSSCKVLRISGLN